MAIVYYYNLHFWGELQTRPCKTNWSSFTDTALFWIKNLPSSRSFSFKTLATSSQSRYFVHLWYSARFCTLVSLVIFSLRPQFTHKSVPS